MHSAHLAAAREDELMHVSDLTSSLHELQDGEDDSGAVAVGAIKSEDDMKRVAARVGKPMQFLKVTGARREQRRGLEFCSFVASEF